MTPTILFLHGLESAPHGSKYRALVKVFGEGSVLAPDFRGVPDAIERLRIAEEATRGLTGLFLVGSSFGGLVGGLLASQHPERIRAAVFAAPAFHRPAASGIERVPEQSIILHGTEDDVVPIEASRTFSKKFGVPVVEVEDGHRLKGSEALMVGLTRALF